MTLPVYYCYGLSDDSLQPGDELSFAGAEGQHAATVRRTKPGELIEVVDGEGTRVRLAVTAVTKGAVTGSVSSITTDPQHSPYITLVQALAKGGRDEQAIETATEYGVDAAVPWQADRSVARWEGAAKLTKGAARWQSTVLAAMKQSRRSWLPRVLPFVRTAELVGWVRERVASGAAVYVCHEEAQERLTDVVAAAEPGHEVVLIVGPEGGISAAELDALAAVGARPVLLGEHVLRSSSAGPWAIAVIRALCARL